MSGTEKSQARIAFALLCGVALCCSVMYLTADGETVHLEKGVEKSIESMDVLKAGMIISETPHGRQDFMTYFTYIEDTIATEVANRKSDIADCRAIMARDFAFNSAARAKLKRNMLHKMAVNAKIARRHLNKFLRRTQRKFAQMAYLQNKRNEANKARDAQTEKYMKADAAENAHQLKLAQSSWQKSTNAWAAHTNARIDRMNKHVAANAAQIKENAKRARKDLENAMNSWDHKVANFRTEEKNANSRLGAQFAAQSKATKAWANNKIKRLVAQTGAQFNDVETKMAKNRHDVDMALQQAAMRFAHALNAFKALQDKRFAQTQASIVALKSETQAKVDAMKSQFKVSLLSLSSTVKKQVSKVNKRIDQTAGVVRSNAAEQAKVNANVNAEMTRMIKVGNDRYKKQLMKDSKLQNLIVKDKADTDKELSQLAASFNAKLAAVRKTLAANRKHAEGRLKKATGKIYGALLEQQDKQRKKNLAMAKETRRVELDAMDNIRRWKAKFQQKIHHLAKVVKKNDQKADKKIKKLTGVVAANAAKSAAGRQQLFDMEQANKEELHKSIDDAIAVGEKRAQMVEKRGTKMDKDTRWLMNNKLNAEITKLRDETDASVESLALQSKEARAEMRKEMLYAIRSAAEVAKGALDEAIRDGEKKLLAYKKKADESHAKSAMERKALKDEIAANSAAVKRRISDVVAADARAQAALAHETAKAIKKTNTDLTAISKQMNANVLRTRAAIQAQEKATLAKIAKESKKADAAAKSLASKDAKRRKMVLDKLADDLLKAGKKTEAKFGAAFQAMAKAKGHADRTLGVATEKLNDSLAKQAALLNSAFEKTVKNIKAAREQATAQVAQARKDFSVAMIASTAEAKNTENKLVGLTEKASAEAISFRANQLRVNRKVDAELKRIEGISNKRFTESKKARGQIRRLMNENKAAAKEEVAALTKDLNAKVAKLRAKSAHNKREMAKDLSKATEAYYEKLGAWQKLNEANAKSLNGSIQAEKVQAAGQLASAKKLFSNKIMLLSDIVTANAKSVSNGMTKITGVVDNIAKANKADRALIKDEVNAMEADLNKALDRAISIGEAKAKAVAQRIAEHQKNVKSYLQVELAESLEDAADGVLRALEANRLKIGQNYLSLKAYAAGALDSVQDVIAKGHGKSLSAIGDLLQTVGNLAAVKTPKRSGPGMGGSSMPAIFNGGTIQVSPKYTTINGLVDEYSQTVNQVRMRWPLGLGKYLMDKVEMSMPETGILQVDKVSGQSGQFVYINGRSIGLSNKLDILEKLAVRMPTYESILAKLTSRLNAPARKPPPPTKPYKVKMPSGGEWQGD
jgi:hypothetical protein